MRRGWLLLGFLFACQVATGPAEPVWGKHACAHCAMLLSDRRAAAQVQRDDGEHVYFDDIGCMVAWLAADESKLRGRWVRTPDARGWAPAEFSYYALEHATPMDYGVLPAPTGLSFEAATQHIRKRVRAHEETFR